MEVCIVRETERENRNAQERLEMKGERRMRDIYTYIEREREKERNSVGRGEE